MKKKVLLLFVLAALYACSSSETEVRQQSIPIINDSNTNEPPAPSDDSWSIPISEVLDGGPGRDGIPALIDPEFTSVDEAQIIKDEDLVLGIKKGDDVRAYSHIVLDWHEIINDDVSGTAVAVTYCPLTGTGIGWNRSVNGPATTFGVSGLLYQTNLIPFDRATNSNWSQILNEAVNGPLIGTKAKLVLPLIETDWQTWKRLYPETRIISLNTGFGRPYGVYPYLDYKTNHDAFLFPVPLDDRLPAKERVLALVYENQARVYRFSDFAAGDIIRDTFHGKQVLVAGNPNFIVAFDISGPMSDLQFTYAYSGSEVILTDNEGNEWNIFGEAVNGPRQGEQLQPARSFMAYWFSIPAFYATTIYKP